MNYQTQEDARLADLLRRLGQDAGELIKHEIALAKLELRESISEYAKGSAKLAAAAVVALLGALTLIAFLIIGLGDVLNNYWLSALIVTVVLLGLAGFLARSALAGMKGSSITPETTVQTLEDDKRWAEREAHDFKRKLEG